MQGPVSVGIDVGTTNITITVVSCEDGTVVDCRSVPNDRIDTGEAYAYAQDPQVIEASVYTLIRTISQPVRSFCVTGQVHGILYYDRSGRAVSPLYTWLDQRALVEVDGKSSLHLLAERTGVHLPSGYGLLAHYANRRLDRVPQEAIGFCGILEYITGRLVGQQLHFSDPSCLGTYGAFDPVTSRFDPKVLQEVLGSADPGDFLEACSPFALAGHTKEGVPVAYAVGDNQAGFFGMVSDWEGAALVSLGTSGQISLFTREATCPDTMELRPFLGEGYLQVGATLAAGKAYEVLERFFASIVEASGQVIDHESIFSWMKQAADGVSDEMGALRVDTRFAGSRKDAHVRGAIRGIELDNFTAGNLVLGTVSGIVKELHNFVTESGIPIRSLVAIGSSVRKNHLFRNALRSEFSCEPIMPELSDGAGYGAALIGAIAAGTLSLDSVHRL